MSLLTRTPTRSSQHTAGTTPIQSPLVLGAVGGAQAAAGSLLCVLVPAVIVWMASTSTEAGWTEAVRVGAGGWLLAHHGSITVDGGHLSLVPLGVTLLPLAWCWSAGRRLGHALTGVGPTAVRGQAVRAWGALTVAYAAVLAVVGLVTASPVARPVTAQAAAGALVLAGTTGGAALARALVAARTDGVTTASYLADALHLPRPARSVVQAAAVALMTWVAAAALVTMTALLLGWDRIGALREALAPGPVGGLGLVLLDVVYVPTAVLWSGSWLAGPGFAVGAGTAVTPAATSLGPLPAFPLLGALPEPGMMPGWMWAAVAVPVLAGVAAGVRLRRSTGGLSRPTDLALAAAVAAAAGAGAFVLSWLSTGAVGADRMAVLGPSPAMVAVALAGEVLAGCLIAVLLLPRSPAVPEAAGERGFLHRVAARAKERLEPVQAQPRRLGKRLRSSTRRS